MNNNFSGLGWDVGFSLFSSIDLGFEYLKTSYVSQSGIDVQGTIIYAAYNFKNKNTSIKILAGYSNTSIESKYIYTPGLTITGPLLSISVSPKIYENESWILMPSFGFSMIFLSQSNTNSYNYYSFSENNISVGLGLNFVSKINKEFYFVLAPSISKDLSHTEDSIIYGFNFGLLFNVPEQ